MDYRLNRRSKPSRRLDRRNAIKNIDYEAPSTSSSSSSDLSHSLRTRSLDVSLSPLGNQTSFRVRGVDGEIERILMELGLSDPEELAISADAWEARKGSRSVSDVLPRSRLHLYDDEFAATNSQPVAVAVAVAVEEVIQLQSNNDDDEDEKKNVSISNSNYIPTSTTTTSSNGIKGVRPPFLSPPSPPSLPPSNQWPLPHPHPDSTGSSSSSPEEEETMVVLVLSKSSSSSTFNDDDSSSTTTTTTDPMCITSPDATFKRSIRSWIKGALLGSGSFGTVYEGFSDDGFFFAVKEVSLLDQGNQAKQSISQLEQEISLLSQFQHENIVQYLGTDKDEEKLYIFLELVTKGSLAQLYQKYPLQDSQVSAYTRQILHGLSYLHERKVVHRDIKCANILVDANGSVKLADFGLAKATKFNDVKSCKGTAFWMAPEVVNRKSRGYGLAADIWSLGCTVLEMLTRQLPYSHLECPMQALFRIGKGEPPPVPNSLSEAARDFIHQCLQVKADDRPPAAKLLEHPFVKRPLSASTAPGSPLHHNGRRP